MELEVRPILRKIVLSLRREDAVLLTCDTVLDVMEISSRFGDDIAVHDDALCERLAGDLNVQAMARDISRPGQAKEFQTAWAKARAIITAAKGCKRVEMRQGVESPDNFMLLVEWETLEDHMQGFRQSPAIKEFGALLAPFFAGAPSMDHYRDPL